MNILTILGSPRKRGNTAAVLRLFEAAAEKSHAVERIDLVDFAVEGCLGCDACQRTPDRPGCRRKDDAAGIFEKILASDLTVYASPVYVWDFTAQMKALMDRHYCLVKWSGDVVTQTLLEGRHAALLCTCGGAAAENADLIQQVFQREMRYLRCAVMGKYVVDLCTTPRALGERAEAAALRMLQDLSKLQEPKGSQ
jgi:multimeric flavodoxin WrbA